MNVFIDGGNIGTEMSHFLLGLYEIRLQGIEAILVLATSMGHDDEGMKKGWVGSKYFLKNDRYECDKGEREIQWNRSQIIVQQNPKSFFFFYTCRVIL
jgi:hypothetical protein